MFIDFFVRCTCQAAGCLGSPPFCRLLPPHFYRLSCPECLLLHKWVTLGSQWSPGSGLEPSLDPGLQGSWAGRQHVLDRSMAGAWHQCWACLSASGPPLYQAWLCFSHNASHLRTAFHSLASCWVFCPII